MYIVKPPPVFSNETGLNPEFFLENIIPNIEKVAKQTNLPIIDVYSALANSSNLFPDGVHPNAEGAQLIANDYLQRNNPATNLACQDFTCNILPE